MGSIMQKKKFCLRCGRTEPLHLHHCLAGSYRTASTRYGLTIYLCPECHRAVHDSEAEMRVYRMTAQLMAMIHYNWTPEEFIQKIGRSFL